MKERIVFISGSRRIRRLKATPERAGLKDEADLHTDAGEKDLWPHLAVRNGWAEAFREMARQQDDTLLDGDLMGRSLWDQTEWQW